SPKLHAARGIGDDGLALHLHGELPPFSVRHRVGITRGFTTDLERLVRHVDPPEPFHTGVASPAREEGAHWITLLRTQHLAVLAVDEQRIVHDLLDRDGTQMAGSV